MLGQPAAWRLTLAIAALGLLSACAGQQPRSEPQDEDQGFWRPEVSDGPPSRPVDVSEIKPHEVRDLPRSRYGNPDSYVVAGTRYHVMAEASGFEATGIASWYGEKFHGRRTSSGDIYDMYQFTAAHPTLPIPCFVEVTNLANNKRLVVLVNDRGPFKKNRLIDLSYAAAKRLDYVDKGTARVHIRVLEPETESLAPAPSSSAPPRPSSGSDYRFTGEHAERREQIFVQVGVFGNVISAMRVQQDLRDKSFEGVRLHLLESEGGDQYRVRLGPFDATAAAERIQTRLLDAGIDGIIVVEPGPRATSEPSAKTPTSQTTND